MYSLTSCTLGTLHEFIFASKLPFKNTIVILLHILQIRSWGFEGVSNYPRWWGQNLNPGVNPTQPGSKTEALSHLCILFLRLPQNLQGEVAFRVCSNYLFLHNRPPNWLLKHVLLSLWVCGWVRLSWWFLLEVSCQVVAVRRRLELRSSEGFALTRMVPGMAGMAGMAGAAQSSLSPCGFSTRLAWTSS